MDVIAMAATPNMAIKVKRPRINLEPYINRLKARLNEFPVKSFQRHLIENEINRMNKTAPSQANAQVLEAYAQQLREQRTKQTARPNLIGRLIDKELMLISRNQFRGGVVTAISGIGRRRKRRGRLKKLFKKVGGAIKKVVKAVKKIGMAPSRNAFLGLIRLNFRGLAYKVEKGIKRDPQKFKKFWERFGGKFSNLESAVRKGAKKKPLLGSRTKRGTINGNIYDTPVTITGIGFEPTTTSAGAALAAAAPIIAALTPILKGLLTKKEQDEAEATGVDPDTGEPLEKKGGKFVDVLKSVATAAGEFASASGKPTTAAEAGETFEVTDVEAGAPETAGQPEIDGEIEDAATGETERIEGARESAGTGFTVSPLMIGAAAVGIYLLTRKK